MNMSRAAAALKCIIHAVMHIPFEVVETRVARFILGQDTKTWKNIPDDLKNVPHGHKIFPMAVK
jgi:hypothetical protein